MAAKTDDIIFEKDFDIFDNYLKSQKIKIKKEKIDWNLKGVKKKKELMNQIL